VCEEFDHSYADTDSASDVKITEESTPNFQQESTNIFDSLEALAPPKTSELGSELDRYLSSDVEHVTEPLQWWYERRETYPHLSKMALDYLSIPGMSVDVLLMLTDTIDSLATSIDVERLFSRGRLLLSHVHSRLSPQSIRALICLGAWSKIGLVKDSDVLKVSAMPDIAGQGEMVLEDGWDAIELTM